MPIVYRVASLAAFTLPLAVYVASLTPGVGFWDTAEMQTVPYIFGIAHPPGFPAFVMLGFVFSHVFVLGNVAWRLSLMSAIAMAGASWFVFRTTEDEGVHPLLACISAWIFAFGAVVWTRATRAEIHALAMLFIATTVWSALRARTTGEKRFIYACALSLGLAAATHPVMVWIVPGILIVLAPALVRGGWRIMVAAAALGFAPLSLYLYMPLRSMMVTAQRVDPTLGLGLPPGQAFWDYGDTENLHKFVLQLTGAEFPKHDALIAILKVWLYPAFAGDFVVKASAECGVLAVILAVIGAVALFARDHIKGLGLMLVTLAGIPFALSYVVEIDYDRYLLTAYWGMAVFAGIGAQAVVARVPAGLRERTAPALLAVVLLIWAGYGITQNRDIFDQRNDTSAQQFVDQTIGQTPPRAVISAPWVFATPLAYAAYVERRLDGRIVVSAQSEDAGYLAGWARRRPVFVMFYETGPQPVPHAHLVFAGGTADGPRLYRIVPDANGR